MTTRTRRRRWLDINVVFKIFCYIYFSLFLGTFFMFVTDSVINRMNQPKLSEKICVDGCAYVRDGKTAIALLAPDGKPVLCWTK